jgi:uncharacterized protein YktA (UPF0223 family)
VWGLEYQYPFSYDWSTEEVIDVVAFFQTVEKAYEKGMTKNEFMHAYRRFKEIVPGKADEKKYCNEFEDASGYSTYKMLQKMKNAVRDDERIRV